MPNTSLVLPRPGTAKAGGTPRLVPAPSEAAFVTTFGNLLPRASYLETQNGTAAYYELPPSSPPPTDRTTTISRVLFVHGVQTPAIGLQPLASALSSRFPHAHCVLVDLWGHGLTVTPLLPHDPALFHALLEDLIVHLEWTDAHFIGYSFGAATTASFAAAKPDRVASMVLVAPAGFIRKAKFDETERSYLRGGEDLEVRAVDWVLEFLEGGQLVVPSDWKERVGRGEVVAEAVRDWQMKVHEGHVASVVAIVRDGGVMDSDAEFAKAAKTGRPCLSILGELDDLSTVQDLHDVGMRNVAVVPQTGHAVVRQKVPEVAQLIEEFWNKLE
ncbi:putative valacyclovir hydrolase [Thelonectria olida]|uniref:Valacyclovir hydrolase n=1 Tax=Thelonectria olida TaxID=1576542 RepID=A0A9P8W5U2_9HYPO|nr:putative valacyclovir hydrolase [Thelonectria olida]